LEHLVCVDDIETVVIEGQCHRIGDLESSAVVAPTGRRRTPIVVATIAGLALSAVWEMVEWFGYRFITDAIFVTYDDTIGDMMAGGAGALLVGVVASRFRLTRADRAPL
jgi:hypothetical protein